jgi:hypothetical protein
MKAQVDGRDYEILSAFSDGPLAPIKEIDFAQGGVMRLGNKWFWCERTSLPPRRYYTVTKRVVHVTIDGQEI